MAFPARVALSHEKGGRGFLLCPPFDRVAWDQEDTAHTRHTPYTRRIQKKATDQVGEKSQGRGWLFGFHWRKGGGLAQQEGNVKRKDLDSLKSNLTYLCGMYHVQALAEFCSEKQVPMFIQALCKVVTSPFTIESASLSSLQSVGT